FFFFYISYLFFFILKAGFGTGQRPFVLQLETLRGSSHSSHRTKRNQRCSNGHRLPPSAIAHKPLPLRSSHRDETVTGPPPSARLHATGSRPLLLSLLRTREANPLP
ncbi:hypothetical protein VIGAN_03213300, partial [Vigna angularis var. angularis]